MLLCVRAYCVTKLLVARRKPFFALNVRMKNLKMMEGMKIFTKSNEKGNWKKGLQIANVVLGKWQKMARLFM